LVDEALDSRKTMSSSPNRQQQFPEQECTVEYDLVRLGNSLMRLTVIGERFAFVMASPKNFSLRLRLT
jgi:hypothetical protein